MTRWPGIRHLRWWWWQRTLARWQRRVHPTHWLAPTARDRAYLDAVWKGEA